MDEIYATWKCTDRLLIEHVDGNKETDINWDARLRLNTYGYFILLFSQIEAYIDDTFSDCCGNPLEFSFRNRFHNLFSKTSEARQMLEDYYAVRNNIAHGRLRHTTHLDLERVILDFKTIQMATLCGL